MKWILIVGLLCLPAFLGIFGAETNPPAIKQTAPGVFEIGLVRIDSATREVSFPAEINMREGQIEYVVVSAIGKLHESIFKTPAEPFHIHTAALLLLGGGQTNQPAMVEVAIEMDGATAPASDFVLNTEQNTTMKPTRWSYLGSRMVDGVFLAQRDGSIVSLIADPDALLENPGPDKEKDEIWQPATAKLPVVGQPARVKITFPKGK